jgi:catechol-2,3-dioxygenase
MNNAKVIGLRSIELAVRDLASSKWFYEQVWGLREVARSGNVLYLRANGSDHHVLALHEEPNARMVSINLAAAGRDDVVALHDHAKAMGALIEQAPAEFDAVAGGGLGFAVKSPEGHLLTISSDVAQSADRQAEVSAPTRLSHIVLNSYRYNEELSFFRDVLGFSLSDTVPIMDFLRCSRDHHSVALARANGASLNHVAYDMNDIDSLMRGSGRMKSKGFEIEWGVGRHGPGDNVFSYFVEPNGFVVEYTTGMLQVDNDDYPWHGPDYWAAVPFPRPCRWGMASAMTEKMKLAMSGKLVEMLNGDAGLNLCDHPS